MRFPDPGDGWFDFTDEIVVRCPECARRSLVISPVADRSRDPLRGPRRFLCDECGHLRTWKSGVITRHRSAQDPFFGLPVWLQTPCCGNVLWAYNLRHLDLLEEYVGADLRERVWRSRGEGAFRRFEGVEAFTMLERLPAWIKSAGNRTEVLKAIGRLRTG